MIAASQKGGVLFVAGGGQNRINYLEWQRFLAQHGYSSLTFDFPGVEKSPGELSDTSLDSRTANAADALDYLASEANLANKDIVICGRSMGGPIALRIGHKSGCRKIVLFVPAAYADEAYNKPFGEEFSKVIRAADSWKNSSDFKLANEFSGRLMVVYGEEEHIIPGEIQSQYLAIAKSKGTALIMKGIGHNKNLWDDSAASTTNRRKLFELVQEFIES